ncbi:ParB N-terminal domain-containing protein [Eubacteriales bacterium OttesenSCG-928-N13]|nr:ParB N-terminal domain-containing protein [Eubacteriales bacterium OttesenSCG-928-N13]
MNIQTIAASKLNPAPYNPRKRLRPGDAEYEKLKRSILEFGVVEPIVFNSTTGNIVGGHQRYFVLTDLGTTELDCVVVDLDEQREKALNIALNKINGSWDEIKLADLLADLSATDFDVSLTGFDPAELSNLFGEKQDSEIIEDGFDAEKAADAIVEPISRRGDIWLLGEHRLRCGDSTIQSEVDMLMNGQQAKLILTDAPYNVSYGAASHPSWKKRSILNDSMSPEQFQQFLQKAFTCAYNTVMPGAQIFAFMSAQEWGRFMPTLEEIGFHWSSTIIWVKDTLVLGRKDWQPRYEGIFYGWRGDAPRLYPITETRKETDVWEFDRPKRSELHPTQKPLDVLAKAIKFCSRDGDIVLDLFSGSASTLISADQLGRVAYLQELDEKYADVGVRRYVEHKGAGDGVFLLRDGVKIPFAQTGMKVGAE